jgi:hypothetical protein
MRSDDSKEVFAAILSTAKGLAALSEMVQQQKKKLALSGNGEVFRVSVQHLQVVFSRLRRAAAVQVESGLPRKRIENLKCESNRAGKFKQGRTR